MYNSIPPPPPRRHWARAIAIGVAAVLLALVGVWLLPLDENSARQKVLCDQVALCKKYAQSRRRCFGSQDFQECIDRELKGINPISIELCADDGGLRDKPNGAPNFVECIFRELR